MKKQRTLLLVLAAVLVVAVAALMLLQQKDEPVVEESTAPVEEILVLGGIPQPLVQDITIENEVGTFTIRNHGQVNVPGTADASLAFSVDGIDSHYLNGSLIQSVVNTAAHLTAKRVVEGSDLVAYGLDHPVATATITYDSGTARLDIGGESPGGEGTYVAVGGTIYLVSGSQLNNLLLSRLDFVTRTVTPGSSSTSFDRITLTGGNLAEPVVLEKSGSDPFMEALGLASYRMTAPMVGDVDYDSGVAQLTGLFGLTGLAVVGDGDNLADFGLTEPYLTAEVVAEDATFQLILSAPDEEGNVFVQSSDRPFVYRVATASVPFLGLTVFDYQDKIPLAVPIDQVSQVEVFTPQRTYLFILTGEGDELSVTEGDTAVERSAFRQMYGDLTMARYDAPIPPEDETVPGDLLLQYTFRYRDGSPADVVGFYQGPVRKAIIQREGGEPYYTPSAYVDQIVAALSQLLP